METLITHLNNPENWNGLAIRYEWPYVDRIWINRPHGERICLHKIYPIPDGIIPYYHPHPWAFKVKLFSGEYYMNIGRNLSESDLENLIAPPVCARFRLTAGSCYEMNDPLVWHTVEPINDPVYSVIHITECWKRRVSNCDAQKRLSNQQVVDLLHEFVEKFGDILSRNLIPL